MKLPFKNTFLKTRGARPKFIVLHHTYCKYDLVPSAEIDNSTFQLPTLWKNVLIKKEFEVNYHYVIEKIKEDYVATIGMPLPYICKFDDIPPSLNRYSIHVSILGDYNITIPESRLYSIMAYKVISPLMKLYGITPARLFLHNEISTNKDEKCPGEYFDLDRLINQIRRFNTR